ncbi:MAG: hypothetical protein HN390_09200 [Anaerolineae bacterium]|jgi:hypothetical protein|nr:hypothetical protein [Anaerolineae bacterium]MBT7991087.1 hypothetical protein [Anaerolineae bacterium]
MNLLHNEEISPPPGIISSIKAGFDITANQIGIIFFPILLDVFLWLGPQLRIEKLLRSLLVQFASLANEDFIPAAEFQRIQESLNELLTLKINLYSLLRTFPIGVSSLMGLSIPGKTPLAESNILQIETAFSFFLWAGALTFVGWILGSFYFAWVAKVSLQKDENDLRWFGKVILQAIFLSILWMIILITFGVPLLLVFSIFTQINAGLAQVALIFSALFAMWIIVPIFFSAHGIFVKNENLFRSMVSSFNLSRFTLPTSSFFVICVAVLSQGFNILWLTPSTSSWMMGVSILGHAFITTSLLAASFIYYRDMSAWLEMLLEKINSKKATSAQA